MLTTGAKKKIDPRAAAVARAIALENAAVPRTGLDTAQRGLDTATAGYRAKFLTSFDVPGRVESAAKAVAPDLSKTAADLEQSYVADPNNPDYVDPSNIVSLVGNRMQSGREYLSRVTNAVSNLWDKGVQSSRFAVQDAQDRFSLADKQYGDRLSRARSLLDEDRQRKAALEDYERKQQIDRRYAPPARPSAGETITTEEAIKNPGTLGLLAAGVSKVQKQDGGFDFIDSKTGQALRVEDVQARIPGSSIADFLKGSFNPQDTARLKPEQPTATETFQTDLRNGLSAFRGNKKAKKEIVNRLVGQYPDKRKEILQAIR